MAEFAASFKCLPFMGRLDALGSIATAVVLASVTILLNGSETHDPTDLCLVEQNDT